MAKKEVVVIEKNDVEALLKVMDKKYIKRVGYRALRYAATPLIRAAKSMYKMTVKGYSKTGNSAVLNSFKVRKSKKEVALYVGSDYYKVRWLEQGTKERYTRRKKAYRGKIYGSKFFERAYEQTEGKIKERLDEKLRENVQKLIKKVSSNA